MDRINVGIIGTGWCGGIRAETCADSPFVNELHVAETNSDRLAEISRLTSPRSSSADYRKLIDNKDIHAIIISATPETTHFPMARDALLAGKHVFLEKPIAQTLEEADELTDIAAKKGLKFTIGYTQRFNAKYAYVREKILDGTLGDPVSGLVSRHISRALGKKITGRGRLSPAAMEATHDLDFMLWCLEPRKPIRVYAQGVEKVMVKAGANASDHMWIMVTMDDGFIFTIGAGWILPPGYPNFSTTWIEFVGSEGSVFVDDSHRDIVLNTMKDGMRLPMSTMPGEKVGHTYAGGMSARDHALPRRGRARPAGPGDAGAGPQGDGGLYRRGPIGGAARADLAPAQRHADEHAGAGGGIAGDRSTPHCLRSGKLTAPQRRVMLAQSNFAGRE